MPQKTATNGKMRATPGNLLGGPITYKYRRSNLSGLLYFAHPANQRGFFNFREVEIMQMDPKVQFGLWVLRAPIFTARWEVQSDDSQVGEFVDETLSTIWQDQLSKLLEIFDWGTVFCESVYREDQGLIRFADFIDFHLLDVRPFRIGGQFAGFRVMSSHGGLQAQASDEFLKDEKVYAPRAFYAALDAKHGNLYGKPRLATAWEPWMEKRGKHGAVDVRRLWFIKNSFRGGMIRYPEGTTEMPDGTLKDNQEIAREIVETMETGGTIVWPNARDEQGNPLWEYVAPEVNGSGKEFLDYPQLVDNEILEGLGLPPEVVKAAETGSGWSGRSVPFMVFLTSEDHVVDTLIRAIDNYVIRPLVDVNFGTDRQYRIAPVSLVPKPEEQPGGGNPMGIMAGQGGQEQPGQPGGGAQQPDPFSLSERAPVGGVTIGGKHFVGGQFIPSEVLEQASPEERAQVQGGEGQPRTPVDQYEELKSRLPDMSFDEIRSTFEQNFAGQSKAALAGILDKLGFPTGGMSKKAMAKELLDNLVSIKGSQQQVSTIPGSDEPAKEEEPPPDDDNEPPAPTGSAESEKTSITQKAKNAAKWLWRIFNAGPTAANWYIEHAGYSPRIAKLAYYVAMAGDYAAPGLPVGSASVMIAGTIGSPLAPYRAVKKLIDKVRALKGTKPVTMSDNDQPDAPGREAVLAVGDALQAVENEEWFLNVLAVAIEEEGGDVISAVEIAKAVVEENPEPPVEDAPVQLAVAHAPAGGVTIAGKPFKGGEFIPGDVLNRASPEEKAKLQGGKGGPSAPAGKQLASPEDAAAWMSQSDFYSKMTDDELEELFFYREEDHEDVNAFLRGARDFHPAREKKIKETIKIMEDAFQRAPEIPEGTKLYRGAALPAGMTLDELPKTLEDKAFLSTSLSQQQAETFAGEGDFLAEITIPKGVKGAFLHSKFGIGNNQSDKEQEVLLPNGTKFAVDRIEQRGAGQKPIVHLRAIPDNEPVQLAVARAPVGGINVAGQFFPGGRFIPSETIDRASPEEKQALGVKEEPQGAAATADKAIEAMASGVGKVLGIAGKAAAPVNWLAKKAAGIVWEIGKELSLFTDEKILAQNAEDMGKFFKALTFVPRTFAIKPVKAVAGGLLTKFAQAVNAVGNPLTKSAPVTLAEGPQPFAELEQAIQAASDEDKAEFVEFIDRLGELDKDPEDITEQDILALLQGDSVQLADGPQRAPKGGVTIGGKEFRGGEFIPSDVLEAASPEEKAQLQSQPSAEDKKAIGLFRKKLRSMGVKPPRDADLPQLQEMMDQARQERSGGGSSQADPQPEEVAPKQQFPTSREDYAEMSPQQKMQILKDLSKKNFWEMSREEFAAAHHNPLIRAAGFDMPNGDMMENQWQAVTMWAVKNADDLLFDVNDIYDNYMEYARKQGLTKQLSDTPPRSRVRLAEPDRAARESSSPIVDAIIERGATAGIVVSEEARRKVLERISELLKKKL